MRTSILLISLFLFFTTPTLAETTHHSTKKSPQESIAHKNIKIFIHDMVKQYKFDKTHLTTLMAKAHYNPRVIHKINQPFESKPWDFYRSFFVTDKRAKAGAAYWQQHEKVLRDIEQRYGVDPSIIIAIIGVESHYGKYMGQYIELDTLTTLAFYHKKRARFFKKELSEYLLLTRQQKLPPLELNGSYAGALGIPQFMPSSYRHYAIDYDNDQQADLVNQHDEAIASIANYLKKAGWKAKQPIASSATLQHKIPHKIISHSAKPNTNINQLKKQGIRISTKHTPTQKAALIEMQNTNSKEYWVVFENFHAFMRYNPRTTYALAIYLLSQKIRKQHEQGTT